MNPCIHQICICEWAWVCIISLLDRESNIAQQRVKYWIGDQILLKTRPIWTYQRGAFYLALNLHDSLHLATAYWQFRTLCIWSLPKLLRIRIKSPFSYIYCTSIYVHAILHRQNLNFSTLFRLEDGKKCPRDLPHRSEGLSSARGTIRNVRVFRSYFILA